MKLKTKSEIVAKAVYIKTYAQLDAAYVKACADAKAVYDAAKTLNYADTTAYRVRIEAQHIAYATYIAGVAEAKALYKAAKAISEQVTQKGE